MELDLRSEGQEELVELVEGVERLIEAALGAGAYGAKLSGGGRGGNVIAAVEPPADRASLIQVNEAVLADAIDTSSLHFVHGGMRIHVALRPGGASADLAFWGVLMMWEIGYLPVRSVLSARFARTAIRRRREGYDAIGALRGDGSPLERLSSGFAKPTDP